MKLAHINNIKLGYGRTIEGDSFEFAVPMSYKQTQRARVGDEEEQQESDDVEDINKEIDKQVDLLSMVNSWAPKRNLPDIRKVPNTANIQ